ncbi:mcfE [Scenedesmus sp. PABB004]|nr:mcfE [Scenedesmus sp. PABB004]
MAAAERPEAPAAPALWHGPVAGAASGLAARLVTYPADTLKARMQLAGAVPGAPRAYASTLSAAAHMARAEGLPAFYRGLGAVLLGVVPANLAYFGGYEAARAALPPGTSAGAGGLASGLAAQLLAGLVYTPLDIAKERLQAGGLVRGAGGAPLAANARAAFAALASRGGGPLRGYWATNAVWLPWNALYVAGYEALRRAAADALCGGEPASLPAWAVAGASAASAGAAAVATHPLDVVKTRLQVLSAAEGGAALTALGVARRQLAAEGAASFWAGLAPRVLNIAPGCALSWALYEHLKGWMGAAGPA